jgi:hypothetical protein
MPMKPRFQCNTCGEEADPKMCGRWNCCIDFTHNTGESVYAIERRYVSDYMQTGEDPQGALYGARSLCCDGPIVLVSEDIYCDVCGKFCWLAGKE